MASRFLKSQIFRDETNGILAPKRDWLAGVAGFEALHQDSCPIVPAAIVQREGWQQLVRRNSGSGTGPEGRDSSPCPGRPGLRSGTYPFRRVFAMRR